MNLKDNLKNLLKERKLSLNQLSKKTNINKSTLHNYLNGVSPQGLTVLIKLTGFFDISLEELLFGVAMKTEGKSARESVEGERFEITIKKIKA